MRVRILQPLILGFILLGASLLGAAKPAYSQAVSDSCKPQVEQALEQVGKLCDGLSRNSACYGNANVKATFLDAAAADPFEEPGDTANVAQLQAISTAPLDETAKIWGVSLLRLQASVPNSLPGQALIFVLFGDVGVENAVDPADAFVPLTDPVQVTTRSAANVRSSASANAGVLSSVPAGTELPADATSADKGWLRVVSNDQVGWVSKTVIRATGNDLDQLPVLTHASRTPMQSFYLTTSLRDITCNQAPPLIVVQGPEHVTIDLTVNGVDINMGSTIIVRLVDAHTMEIITVDGNVHVGNVPLPSGFAVNVPLSDDGRSQAGNLADVHPLSQEELNGILSVEMIPTNVVNYPIKLPTLSEINQQAAAMGGGGGVVSAAAAAHVTCRSLRATSPLDAWGKQSTTFYWDAAPGATSYRLVMDGVGTVDTKDTNATYDLRGVGADSLTWSVQALYNGEVACQTRPLTLPRDNSINGGGGGQNCHYDITTYSMVCS